MLVSNNLTIVNMSTVLSLPQMAPNGRPDPRACEGCGDGHQLGFDFGYAFQPIVDVSNQTIFAHEALVRGPSGESASTVLSQVNEHNRYKFDQSCRVKAITSASALQMDGLVSINFLPNAIYRPEVCIRTTLAAARKFGFPLNRIMFETVEGEEVADAKWFADVLREYKKIGFLTAIDDFGAGYAGLNLLADFQPDVVKLDMGLIRNIDTRRAAQAIVRGIVDICEQLDIRIISEGVETVEEYHCLHSMGLTLMQGYLFGKPAFESCASAMTMRWPTLPGAHASETLALDVFPVSLS